MFRDVTIHFSLFRTGSFKPAEEIPPDLLLIYILIELKRDQKISFIYFKMNGKVLQPLF